MTALLLSIIAFPLVLLFALWFSARLVSTPWATSAEAFVRLLYFLAIRLQAAAEATDSGLNCYRDAAARPLKPHCELAREIRDAAQRDQAEAQAHIEATKRELQPIPGSVARVLRGKHA